MRQKFRKAALGLLVAALGAVGLAAAVAPREPAAVNTSRMANAAGDSANWMAYGRTYDEQRFSPLAQINDKNVQRLGLAWYDDLGTYRGIESTPLEIDGVLYNISAFNIVTAYDARSGRKLWTYDPKV